MLKKLVLGLMALVLIFVAVVATRPADFTYQRSRGMRGSASAAFALVQDFHHWPRWSPWDGLDPQQKRLFKGAESGTGAIYEWDGNDKVGAGRMTITAVAPSERVDMALEFLRPFPSTAQVSVAFKDTAPGADEVTVTWTMKGQNSFMARAFGIFMDMDKMIGADFERGLGLLDGVLAADARVAAEAAEKKAAEEKAAQEKAAVEPAAAPPDAGAP